MSKCDAKMASHLEELAQIDVNFRELCKEVNQFMSHHKLNTLGLFMKSNGNLFYKGSAVNSLYVPSKKSWNAIKEGTMEALQKYLECL